MNGFALKVDYLRRTTNEADGRKMATIIRCLFKQLVNSSLLLNLTWSGSNRFQTVNEIKTINTRRPNGTFPLSLDS